MKFSVPYNSEDPVYFLEKAERFKEHIHSFYFGMHGIFTCHNPPKGSAHDRLLHDANNYKFLSLVDGKVQTVLCLNTLIYPKPFEETVYEIIRELPALIEVGLTSVNVASTTLADIIHSEFPQLDIQTSCNTYAFINQTSRYWNKCFGTKVFNLPREALRTPSILDDFAKLGFISKCIVNEGCLYGCPGNIEHACSFLFHEEAATVSFFCDRLDLKLSDIFKTNFIPPHRLKEFEGKIDIAKIAGRSFKTDRIISTLKAYIDGDENIDIQTVLHAKCRRWLREKNINFPVKYWPKKTLTCQCDECDTCKICDKVMNRMQNIDRTNPCASLS